MRDYPREHLERLKVEAVLRTDARQRVVAEFGAAFATRRRRLMERLGEVAHAILRRPDDADPAADAVEQQDLRRRLEAMDAGERDVLLRAAARDGDRAYRPLHRAALGAPAVPWASAAFPSLVADPARHELTELLVARIAPDLVREANALWLLWGIRRDLPHREWTAPSEIPAAVPFEDRGGGRVARR